MNKKKKILSFLQLLLGLAIIAAMFLALSRQGKLAELAVVLRETAGRWPFLLAAFMSFLLCLILCAFRWNVLLVSQNIRLRLPRVFSLYFLGHFFNSFMPGAVSGDLVKAYFAAKETHHRKTEIVSTVFMDRVIGLLALIALAVVIMLLRLRFFLAHRETRLALGFMGFVLLGTTAGLWAVFHRNMIERSFIFKRLESRASLSDIVTRAYAASRLCLRRPVVLVKTLLFSLANHVMFVVSQYCIARALGLHPSFWDFLTILPVANAVAGIPITPGGLGTREAAIVYLLGILAIPAATAMTLSLLSYAVILGWSLIGGLVYFFHLAQLGREERRRLGNILRNPDAGGES